MLDKKRIEKYLKASIFGEYLYVFDEIESTNDHAKKLAAEGAPEGTVVLADYQKAGRGRQGRRWSSAAGKNILMSVILRPQLQVETVQRITLATADILIQSLEKYFEKERYKSPEFVVKWPNDILVGPEKLAGILTESSIRDKRIEYAVVGLGINVNQPAEELRKDVEEPLTSLCDLTQCEHDREKLIARLLNDLEDHYYYIERTNYDSVIEDWKKHCHQFGNEIIIETAVGIEEAKFRDVNAKGLLVYECPDGTVKELIAGRVRR